MRADGSEPRRVAHAVWMGCLMLIPLLTGTRASAAEVPAKQANPAPDAATPGHEGKRMKTIGVIGGLGPQATMDFEQRVHRVAQRLIPPRFNSGYPPMIVVYHRRPPVLVKEDGTPRLPLTPDPGLVESVRAIGATADFLVMTSNLPHLFLPQIEQASGRKVLSMIDVTLDAVRARGWKRVGVFGMGHPTVYTDRLQAMGIAAETLDPEQTGPLDRAIIGLMEGRDTEASRQLAVAAVAALRARAVDGIILGCTELPLMLGAAADAPDLLNPAQLLAEAAVAKAIK
jgi:aspartate racemase